MPTRISNAYEDLLSSSRFQAAKDELLRAIEEVSCKITGIRGASSENQQTADAGASHYQQCLEAFSKDRGRDLYYPFLGSGLGRGPLVELTDGSVKYDMITGIGINFFGHSHPELMREAIDAVPSDIMQGNLEPANEMPKLLRAVLSRVGDRCRLNHGWIMCSGTMVNEVALKIIRQKKTPATKILAFQDCFAGRSTAMQEITDNPGYRQGQPTYGEVQYLPFYDPKRGAAQSIERTLEVMQEHVKRYPGKFAALMIELVQGEGGFQAAPREFYTRIFDEAKKAGLAIWVDEIQTFGRTGELFAFQKFDLHEYVDVVTIGKMLQSCMVLFTEEYNPKPGLVAGTFSGSTVALRAARRTLELLEENHLLGPEGKIQILSDRFVEHFGRMAQGSCKGLIRESRAVGGMIAFSPFVGTMEDVKAVLLKLFELGVVAFSCGHGPYFVRFLPPLGSMQEQHVDEVCQIVEKALVSLAKQRG